MCSTPAVDGDARTADRFPSCGGGYVGVMTDSDSNDTADATPTASSAEATDPSVLGERIGDEGRPGDEFPPDEPMGVEDPAIVAQGVIARDDVAQREARLVSEHTEEAAAGARPGPGLIDPVQDEVPGLDDPEQQLVADVGTAEDGPEARAVRTIDDDGSA